VGRSDLVSAAAWSAHTDHTSVLYKDAVRVIGRHDGSSWPACRYYSSVVYNEDMWVI
jgi:hypothetical protein